MQSSQISSLSARRQSCLNSIRQSLKVIPLQRLSSKIQNRLSGQNSRKTLNQEEGKQSLHSQSETQASESEQFQMGESQAFYQKYQLLEKLGQGCNACIYKCQEKLTQRIYAVKKARVEEEQAQQLRQMFQLIKALNHPLISYYKELFYDSLQNVSFTVMEYCPYGNLSECDISEQCDLKKLIGQLVPVIQYLHQHDICHRDIKPENILYDRRIKQIKLIDFGISKKTTRDGEKREMLTVIGSNCYLAPEIYLGGGYDERVDLWSLGITLYKLIAGHTPFESEYYSETINSIIKGEVHFDDKIWKAYSSEAKDFVSRLLKNKEQRMTLEQCRQHSWLTDQKSSCFQ